MCTASRTVLPGKTPADRRTACLAAAVLTAACLAALSLAVPPPAAAQSNPQPPPGLTLTQLDAAAFPVVSVLLDAHGPSGAFVDGLTRSDLSLVENSQPVELLNLEELRPGVQLVVAVNPGPAFAIRNSQAISRYDVVVEALRGWADARQGSTLDDLSLTPAGAPASTHLNNPDEWLRALEAYTITQRTLEPDLDLLVQAVDLAADSPPRLGMERAVLLITAAPEGDLGLVVESVLARARSQAVRIFVWLVASPEVFEAQNAVRLRELAQQTGGQFAVFSGAEALPGLESYLEPLRSIYFLQYRSQLKTAGTHRLSATARRGEIELTSPELAFELNLQPPSPAFLDPPQEINRQFPEGLAVQFGEQADPTALMPNSQELSVLVDFPDGRPRPLQRSALYVDGEIADQNTAPPFDYFTWDLSGLTTSAAHVLRVEVEDSLGLVGTSIDMPIQVNAPRLTANPWAVAARNAPMLTVVIVILAGVLLAFVLVLGGRIGPRSQRALKNLAERRKASDPLTQPVAAAPPRRSSQPRGFSALAERLHWPQRRVAPKAFAFLNRLDEDASETRSAPAPIMTEETTLGRDPSQALLVFDDPSLERLHARLLRQPDGSFRLHDEGSVAGVWVNFALVPPGGITLEHGDILHIGRLGFRFTMREPQRVRKMVRRPVELDD